MGATGFDVFLSHNSRDKATIERIAVKLKQAGLEPWLDVWSLTPGGRWQEEIAAGMAASDACAIFVGPSGIGDWMREELAIAKDRAAKERAFRLFPVLLPGLPEPFDATQLPPFLNTHTWVDLRQGFEDAPRFQPLINAIKGIPLGPRVAIAPRDDVAPYRGLETFDEAHAEFFFGREGDVQRLLEHLKRSRFLAVVGPSGSGKSSLVRAGLLPALRNGRLPQSQTWSIGMLRPGAHPLIALAAELVRLSPGQPMQATLDGLADDPRTLHLATELALAGQPPTTRAVWVVDQFEETFTLCQDEAERAAFLENLLYAAAIPGGRGVVVLAMRADFYPHCAAHAELAARIGSGHYLVGPLSEEGIRQAIVEPAWRVGLSFEDGLVETILADVAAEPGGLPLLAHALFELWQRRRGQMLALEGYRATGGVAGALANRADAVFQGFDPAEQTLARRMLLRLTQPGEGTEDTRRRSTLAELPARPEERAAVAAVVDALVGARLLTVSADEATGEPWIDVAHEALIRSWPRLRGWLDEDRAGLRAHRRLTEAAQEWQRVQRDPDLLYRGSRLAEAQALAARDAGALNPLEQDFLDASVALRERERVVAEERLRAQARTRRRVMIGLTGFSVLALLLAALAGWQWWEAGQQRQSAVQAGRLALSRQLAAQAVNARSGGLDTRLLLSLEANRLDPTGVDARGSLFEILARNPHLEAFLSGHQREVDAVAFRPDGEAIATAGPDGVFLWDGVTGARMAGPFGGFDGWMALAFSPDGTVLAYTGANGTIGLLDAKALVAIQELRGEPEATWFSLAFSPDGDALAAAGTTPGDGVVALWDWRAGERMGTLHGSDTGVNDVVFSPDGLRLISGDQGGHVVVWNWRTRERVRSFSPTIGEWSIMSLALSPDGARLAVGIADGSVLLVDAETLQGVGRLSRSGTDLLATDPTIQDVAFSPDGSTVAAASDDGVVYRWNVTSRELRDAPLAAHAAPVFGVAFSPDGQQLVSGAANGTVALWTMQAEERFGRKLNDEANSVKSLALAPDGRTVAAGNTIGGVQFWDMETGQRLAGVILASLSPVTSLAISPDGRLLAAGDQHGGVGMWDMASLKPVHKIPTAHSDAVTAVTFINNGAVLASSSLDSSVRFWDVATGATVGERLDFTGDLNGITSMALRPDGSLLAVSGTGIQFVDTTTMRPVGESMAGIAPGNDVNLVAFSPDGKTLAAGGFGGVALLDVVTRQRVGAFFLPQGGSTSAVAFSPDGATLATGGSDGSVRLWDLATRQVIGQFPDVHEGFMNWLLFSLDGRLLASDNDVGDFIIWDTDVDSWQRQACAIASRNLTHEEWTQYLGVEPYQPTCPDLPVPGVSGGATGRSFATPASTLPRGIPA